MKNLFHVFFVLAALAAAAAPAGSFADELIGHKVVTDGTGRILPWAPYGKVMTLAWDALKSVPAQANGLRTYYTYSRFSGDPEHPFDSVPWAHNPAGLASMLAQSAIPYYAYSGDREALAQMREFLDYFHEHGTTPADWEWSSVPFASGFPGEPEYRGADDRHFCHEHEACGRGDGEGFIEPDKVGEVGQAYLKFHQLTGEAKYLDAALACANALAKHVRAGDAKHSPWPFRVDGRTGKQIREEYTSNVLGPIVLFDQLQKLKLGDLAAYQRARAVAWDWMMKFPIRNMNWSAYFEDIPIHEDPSENPNQYSALETARYLMENPQFDPQWRTHAKALIDWSVATFAVDWTGRHGLERGIQWGAEVISEQRDDMAKMGSHTARYASVQSLWFEKTGDTRARTRAFRSFNWATYVCSERGVVKVGTNDDEGYWFTDGYGDYMRHFLSGIASVPEWAPVGENHLLRTRSMVREIEYGDEMLRYATLEARSVELFTLRSEPVRVQVGDRELSRVRQVVDGTEGYSVERLANGNYRVSISHASPVVRIDLKR